MSRPSFWHSVARALHAVSLLVMFAGMTAILLSDALSSGTLVPGSLVQLHLAAGGVLGLVYALIVLLPALG